MTEIYKRINWNNLTELSKDKRLYVELKMGEIDSLKYRRKTRGTV